MASAGTVTIDFAAETAKFTAELKKVNGQLNGLKSSFTSLEKAATRAFQFLSVAAFGAFIKSSADAADALGKTAEKLQISTEALKAFQLAAKDAGVEQDEANKLLIEGQKRLALAAQNQGDAVKVLNQLGLNIAELRRLQPDELFRRYSAAVAGLASTGDRAAAAQALMGKTAAEALGFIVDGNEKLDEARGFVDKFSLALSRVDTKKVEIANDDIDRLGAVAEAAGQRIAAGLAPFVSSFANALLASSGNLQVIQTRAEKFGAIVQVAFGIAGNAARVLQAGFFIVGEVVSAVLASVSEAIAELFDIIAKGADAVASFQLSIVNLIPGELGEKLRAKVQSLQAPFLGFVHGISDSTHELTDTLNGWVDQNRQAADDALSHVQSIQQIQDGIIQSLEQGRKRAEEAAKPPVAGTGALGEGIDVVALRELQINTLQDLSKENADFQLKNEQDITKGITEELTKRFEFEQALRQSSVDRERQAQQSIKDARNSAVDAGIAALQAFSGKSKALAIALVAINKARSIAQAIQNTSVAVTGALASLPYPANLAAASQVKLLGGLEIAAIVASGFGEVQAINSSGTGGSPIGTPTNPVITQGQSQEPTGATSQRAVQVIFNGPVFDATQTARFIVDTLKSEINDRDVVVITNTNSAQYNLLKNG